MIGNEREPRGHLVQFYDEEPGFLDSLARYVGAGLGAGETLIVIATAAHREAVESSLRARGFDLERARSAGRYRPLDAEETLARIMPEGHLDRERFLAVVGASVREAVRGAPSVRIFGELVALLWARGQGPDAIALEKLWNELRDELAFSLLCAYPLADFANDPYGRSFLTLCAQHTGILPADGSMPPLSTEEHRKLIRHLEQRVHSRVAPEESAAAGEEAAGRLAAIVECSDDAIIGKDLDGVVTSWNRGAERIFGYRAEEMIGQPISRIIPEDRRDDFPMILDSVRRGDRVDHYETERVRKDGRRIYVSLSVSPIQDATGRIVGISKIARDVTERRRLDEQRERLIGMAQRAHAELENASRAKDEFLATLGHELRNPIAAVRNAIESAQFVPASRERAMEIASRQARQLSRLVDDLLDLARITQGRVRLNREIVPLNAVVAHAVEAMQFRLEERGHKLSVSRTSDSVRIECDALRLEQVLVNLLGNAAKFTPPGGHIAVRCESSHGEAVIRVCDDGIGIGPELLTRIFDPFVQVPRQGEGAREGLGVGLAIVRSFVTLHGGTISAHSEGAGKGAEFVVRLPAVPEGSERRLTLGAASETPQSTGKRILIVEDNPDVAEGMAMLLTAFGHSVRIASSGPDGLGAAQTQAPDLMLVDIGLPGMNGYEVARRVRQSEAAREVVLVALTGYGLDEDRERARQAGFDHHLTKPVDPKVLRQLAAAPNMLPSLVVDGEASRR